MHVNAASSRLTQVFFFWGKFVVNYVANSPQSSWFVTVKMSYFHLKWVNDKEKRFMYQDLSNSQFNNHN